MKKTPAAFLRTLIVAACPFAGTATVHAYTHPGVPFLLNDLNALKANINQEPWKSGYAALANDSRSSLSYSMQGPFTEVKRAPDLNLTQWRNDMTAVYNLACMWWFTGNAAYAQKSHDILLAWANTQTSFGGGEAGLDLGDYVYCYAVGADILRGTWSGWQQADTDKVKTLFNLYWDSTGVGGNTIGPANKGTLVMAAGAGIAAFNDDTVKLGHIADLVRTSASSGLLNILPSGQVGETGRDGGHAYGQWASLAFASEVLWKQGIDVYSEMDNRLFAAGEYYCRLNTGGPTPYVPFGTIDALYWTANPYVGWAGMRRGLAILHGAYGVRKGLSSPFAEATRKALPIDPANFMYEKAADVSTASALPPVVFPQAGLVGSGLTDTDIGGALPVGASSYANGTWTVTGGGSEIWTHGSDSCHFTYKQVTGDCSMVVKVGSVQNTAANAKAGIMIRSDLTASAAKRSWIAVRPDHKLEYYQHGWTSGGVWGGSNWESGVREYPTAESYWLKIERMGNVISLYSSVDGASWAAVSAGEYAGMPSTAYIGITVCSLSNGTGLTAGFSNVAVTGGTGASAVSVPEAPRAVCVSAVENGRAIVRWTGSFGATSYKVMRAAGGGAYATVATVTKPYYEEGGLSNGVRYDYQIRAVNAVGESASSAADGGTPSAALASIAFGGTAGASAGSGIQGADSAFDTNAGSKWFTGDSTPTGWLRYDFGAGNEQTIKAYAIVAANDVPQRDPSAWQFQGSSDGTTWTTLDTRSSQTFPYRYARTLCAVASPAAYRYYRLNVTANSGSGYGLQLSEFELLSDVGRTIPDGTCRVLNRKSNKALDLQNGSTANGTPLVQWGYSGAASQKWTFSYQGNGQYKILGAASGTAVDVSGASTADGAALLIWPWGGGNNQRWMVTPGGDGFFKLTAVHSGKVADVSGGSTADGASVIQWPYGGAFNQQWSVSVAP